ncbi:SGNH/GDSL hydrolase family protein [Actinoplanes sp. DH11]|uniref:SGNH/GDSL hydrolase family protein n=1 Tax=Actinoplanes sp. DH11 TaxID=2857011 RepID=UPI001E59D925|nr:SGNH/GDSL hydrolase family protein [Actinoplanes sp. DH11]
MTMAPAADVHGPVRRTVAFVAATALLLGSARSGATAVTVWVVFAVFISVATIWIRGQYADSLDGCQWVVPLRAGVAVALLTFLLVVLLVVLPTKAWFGDSFLGVSGAVLLYLLIGSLLTYVRQCECVSVGRWRMRLPTGRLGVWLTGGGVLVVVAGAWLLGSDVPVLLGTVTLAFGGLLLLPVGLALSAEGALRALCKRDKAGAVLWKLGAGGLVLFAGATYCAVDVSASRWLTVVLVVLGLLVFALVSTTQADVVAALAVVALMGVTPSQESKENTPDPTGGKRVLVALGDSYMSGEGASVYYDGTDNGGVNECRRAPTAWAVMAARTIPAFDGIQFLACSGARTRHVMMEKPPSSTALVEKVRIGMSEKPGRQYVSEEHTQLDAYRTAKGFKPAMVVLSIGGNDAGFSSIGQMCLAPGECQTRKKLWNDTVPQLRNQLRATYFEISTMFPDTPVVVIPYPDPIRPRGKDCTNVGLSAGEQTFIREYVTRTLNAVIRDTAREYAFHYLDDMQDALANSRLQLCDEINGSRPGINFIGLRSVHGFAHHRFNPAKWVHGSLHPNERGHAAMLKVFQSWLADQPHPISPRTSAEVRVRSHTVRELAELAQFSEAEAKLKAKAESPPCDLLAATEHSCRRQAQTWAYRQIGDRLVKDGLCLWIAAAAGGAWCAGVAFFGWRRRAWASECG